MTGLSKGVMTGLRPGVLETLVDPRTGIIRELSRPAVPAQLPGSFQIVASRLSDSRQFSPWASDSAGAGYAFNDEPAAIAAAVGEAVERYCGNLLPDNLVSARYTDLRRAGDAAVDPGHLVLFSATQYAQPGFPWRPFGPDVTTHWTLGRSLLMQQRTWVPACVVWPTYALNGSPGQSLAPVLQAGLATGPDQHSARTSALLEVLERDAMAMSWHGRTGATRLVVDTELAALARGPQDRLRTEFFAFTSPYGVPVIGALVQDASSGYLALGTGCRADPRAAAVKALGEAFQLILLLAEYDDPAGAFAVAARQPGSPLQPWRADRSYLDAYQGDLSDVRDYGCHLQLALDPAYQVAFRAEFDVFVAGSPSSLAEVPHGDLTTLVQRLAADGREPVAVDVTTDDVGSTGLHVTRVLVPSLICNSAAGFPTLGGTRLSTALAGRRRRVLPLPH